MPEPEPRPRRSVELTDPRALRAYAHPTRMTLVGLLRTDGPFTATRAAELTGESVASCSYHLRMLAKYGLVEEAGGGHGREKPWRATARYTEWGHLADDPATAEAADVLSSSLVDWYSERMKHAVETRHLLPRDWRAAEYAGDDLVYLTPSELTALNEQISALLTPYEDRFTDPARRPEGAALVSFVRFAIADRRHLPGEDPP